MDKRWDAFLSKWYYFLSLGLLWLFWQVFNDELVGLIREHIPEGGLIMFLVAHPQYVMPVLLILLGLYALMQSKRKTAENAKDATGLNVSTQNNVKHTVEHDKLIESLIRTRTAAQELMKLTANANLDSTSASSNYASLLLAGDKYKSAIKLLKQGKPRRDLLIKSLVSGLSILDTCKRKNSMYEFKSELDKNSKDLISQVDALVTKEQFDTVSVNTAQTKSVNGHELKIEVQRGICQRREQVTIGSSNLPKVMVDLNPMMRIIVTVKFTPIGRVPVQSLELHSNGQIFKCVNLPSVFDQEDTYTLGFDTSFKDIEAALGKGGNFIRVVTPIIVVTSNSFVLESVQSVPLYSKLRVKKIINRNGTNP